MPRGRTQRARQPGADGHEDAGKIQHGRVVANGGYEGTAQELTQGQAHDERQGADAGLLGRGSLDGLEPEGHEVGHGEESRAEAEDEPRAKGDGALLEHGQRQKAVFATEVLHKEEGEQEQGKDDKQGDDPSAVPGVLGPAPFQGQKKTDGGGDQECRIGKKEGSKGLKQGQLLPMPPVGGFVKEQQGGDGHRRDGQVDVEAPSPGHTVGKRAPKQRTADGGDAGHGADAAEEGGPQAQRDRGRDDEERAGEDARATQARHSPAQDEDGRRRADGADERPEREDANGGDVDGPQGEDAEQATEEGLKGSHDHEIGRTVPTHVSDRVEVGRDARDGSCYDGAVLARQNHVSDCLQGAFSVSYQGEEEDD